MYMYVFMFFSVTWFIGSQIAIYEQDNYDSPHEMSVDATFWQMMPAMQCTVITRSAGKQIA